MAEPTNVVMIKLGLPVVSFFVFGKAAPAGSKTVVKSVTEDGRVVSRARHARKSTAPWMAQIRQQAGELRVREGLETLEGPLWTHFTFWRARPKGHLRIANNQLTNEVKARAPEWPDTQPDLTKLVRAVEDALTQAEIWKDDARVVLHINEKRFCESWIPGRTASTPGVAIVIGRMVPGCGGVE